MNFINVDYTVRVTKDKIARIKSIDNQVGLKEFRCSDVRESSSTLSQLVRDGVLEVVRTQTNDILVPLTWHEKNYGIRETPGVRKAIVLEPLGPLGKTVTDMKDAIQGEKYIVVVDKERKIINAQYNIYRLILSELNIKRVLSRELQNLNYQLNDLF